MEMIEIKNLSKSYGAKNVYDNFNLNIADKKILAVLGESGSGKTTLLNCIAKLTDYSGEILGDITPVSMVFREDRLIPNLTVSQNLKLTNPNIDVISELEKVGLKGEENSYPKTLSAGMSKRVALLRAITYPSNLMLMDEPFANLDVALKYSLIDMVKSAQAHTPKTIIAVTHDVKEAVTLADRVVVIAHGKIVYDIDNITKNTEKELFELMLNIGDKN